jgi:phenylalanyl-tRNA synthetase alpha chain
MNASSWLQSKTLVKIEDHIKTVYVLGKEGKQFLQKGFPEKRALQLISDKKGKLNLKELLTVLNNQDVPVAIGWLKKKGWATIKKEKDTVLEITEDGKKALKTETNEEKILRQIGEKPNIEIDKNNIKFLLSRKNVIKEKEVITSTIVLTENGKKIIQKGIELKDEISQITSATIKTGQWKTRSIRPYDINTFAPAKFGGKPHPMLDLISRIRQIFLEMGFEEVQGDFVETCFWNMDMLFIPQDHPAREMQDTLYCKTPSNIKLNDKNLVEKIAKVHEDGGVTTSTGWGYKFSKKDGERALLRTHTTVNTIRYLYNNPKPPSKVFSIGRVFRKENIDSTHLPEFYQIEGI